jgi:hypothetical protein
MLHSAVWLSQDVGWLDILIVVFIFGFFFGGGIGGTVD